MLGHRLLSWPRIALLCRVCRDADIGRSLPTYVKQTGVEGSLSPANTIHCPIVGSMLGQRRRRWTNIEPALGQCLVFAGRQGTVTRD